MTMKAIRILIISILCFSLQGCPYPPEEPTLEFEIINSSTTDIHVTESHNAGTVLVRQPEESDKIPINGVKTEQTSYSFFEQGRLLTIFIYKDSTLTNNSWQEIKDQGLYDKRYDLTFEELKAMNFEIIYTED